MWEFNMIKDKVHVCILHASAALCDLGASVSTIPKILFDKLGMGPFKTTELRLHLADSTCDKL